MAFETKEKTGSLFLNDKQGNESRPDFTGKMMIGGKLIRIAGWRKVREGSGGEEWISLKFTEMNPAQDPSEPKELPPARVYGFPKR